MEKSSSSVNCKCGNTGWIVEDEVSDPCPVCGRRYEYKKDKKTKMYTVKLVKKKDRGA